MSSNIFSQMSYAHVPGLVIGAVLMVVLITYLIPLARKIGLVDDPAGRKTHTGSIPLIGGIVIASSFSLSLLLFPDSFQNLRVLFFGIGLLTIVGALDDQKEIGPHIRFLAQVMVALFLVVLDQTLVTYVGFILDDSAPIGLGLLAIPFSIIALVGTINAYNMIDGHDGVSGFCFIVSLLGLLTLLSFRSNAGDQQYIVIIMLLIVLTTVFIPFNLGLFGSQRKIFLGDAGSMVFGLVMAFLLIRFSQREIPVVATTAAAWIVGVPLLDMIAVIIRRLQARVSITTSDRKHIHHLLCDHGIPSNFVILILVALHSSFVSIGVLGTLLEWPDMFLFWGTFMTLGLYFLATLTVKKPAEHYNS